MITNGMLTLSSNTVFYVNNTGPALVAGNYLIVSNVTGALPPVMVSGGGATSGMTASLQIENNELDLVVAPAPAIGGIRVSGTMLTLTVTNGPARQTYILLESTNLALPVARWKPARRFRGSARPT